MFDGSASCPNWGIDSQTCNLVPKAHSSPPHNPYLLPVLPIVPLIPPESPFFSASPNFPIFVREVMHSCRVSRALTRREEFLDVAVFSNSNGVFQQEAAALLCIQSGSSFTYISNLNSNSHATHAINHISSPCLMVKIFVVLHQKLQVYVLSRKYENKTKLGSFTRLR